MCKCLQICRRLIAVVIQGTLDEQPVVKVGREAFSVQGAVHIEHGNPVCLRNETVRVLVHRFGDKLHDGLHGGRGRRPVSDLFRCIIFRGLAEGNDIVPGLRRFLLRVFFRQFIIFCKGAVEHGKKIGFRDQPVRIGLHALKAKIVPHGRVVRRQHVCIADLLCAAIDQTDPIPRLPGLVAPALEQKLHADGRPCLYALRQGIGLHAQGGERTHDRDVVCAEEAELPGFVFQLALQLLNQRVRDIHRHQRRTVFQHLVFGQEPGDLCPVRLCQVMAESGLGRVRFFIVLQNQCVGHLTCRFDGPCQIRFTVCLHRIAGSVGQQVAVFAALIDFTVLHVDGVHDQPDGISCILRKGFKTPVPVHGCNLCRGVGSICIRIEFQMRTHEVLQAAAIGGILDRDVCQRKHARREIPGRSPAALFIPGVEPDLALPGNAVFRDQTFLIQPLPEVLAHVRLLDAALDGQLAGFCRPRGPGMGCQLLRDGPVAGQGCPQIVPAEYDDLFERIVVCRLRLLLCAGKDRCTGQQQGCRKQHRKGFFHVLSPPSYFNRWISKPTISYNRGSDKYA